jgi:hypothetical protein
MPGHTSITMDFIALRSYDNYIPAHILMGRLEEEGIKCWLKDEYSVTIDPFLSNAIGGIKVMVASSQADRALELVKSWETEGNSFPS